MNHPLKLGFIGGALDSAVGMTHNIASQMDGHWKLVAGCFSTDMEMNQLTAKKWNIKSVYSDYKTLLEVERGLDAVVVLTPTPSHAEIVIAALSYGYPVICEKALATSSQEIARIKQTLQTNSGFLAVTYNYTGYPMLRELKNLIAQGKLGKIQQLQIEMPQEGFLRLDKSGEKNIPQQWRLQDYAVPTLSLDLGVHLHHMVHFLTMEKPVEVIAMSNNFGFFEGINDNMMCMARYTNNVDCQFWFSKVALGHTNGLRIRIYGSEGSSEWYQMQPESLIINNNKGVKNIIERSSTNTYIADKLRYNRFKAGHPSGFIEAFANHYCDLAESLKTFKQQGNSTSPWVFGVDIAQEGLWMLEAMQRSIQTKSWQSVSEV